MPFQPVFAAVHCHSGYGLHHSDVTALPPICRLKACMMPNTSVLSSLTVMYFPRCSSRRFRRSASCCKRVMPSFQPVIASSGAHDSLRSSASYPPFPEHGDCRGKVPSVAAATAHCAAGYMPVILSVALSADRKGLTMIDQTVLQCTHQQINSFRPQTVPDRPVGDFL